MVAVEMVRSGQTAGILKLKQIIFLDRLFVKKKEGVKCDPKVVGLSTWKDGIALTDGRWSSFGGT